MIEDGNQSAPPVLPPHPVLDRYYRDTGERRTRVNQLFDDTARHYDRITSVMSFGSGSWYRRQALLRAGLAPGMSVLDVACGTGVVAGNAAKITGPGGLTIGLDPSWNMLSVAKRQRVRHAIQGMAEHLPFQDDRFDLVSMGYALRHVADLRTTFLEYLRVLKPGGAVLILEITPPRSGLSRAMLKAYMKFVVPPLAWLGTGNRKAHTLMSYYWDTTDQCVPPDTILGALGEAGFEAVARSVQIGIFSEYTARKPA